MSTLPSMDAKAVVVALGRLTTQVGRIADALPTPVVSTLATTDDDATTPATTCSAQYTGVLPVGDCIRPAGHTADTDHTDDRGRNWGDSLAEYPLVDAFGYAERTQRRPPMDPVHILGAESAAAPGPDFTSPLTGIEVRRPCPYCGDRQMIPTHQYAEHIARLHPEEAPAADEDEQRIARRASLMNLLARLQRGGMRAEESVALRQHVETEIREADTARAVAAGNKRHVQHLVPALERAEADANHNADQVADAVRRAESAERDLRTLRTGLRAAGGDPTQIQNLWAQLRLRNRQWAEAKREVRVVRSALEEEGGDVRLVDEMLETVANAEGRAREAAHERDVIAADLETADRIRAEEQRDRDQHAAVLAEVLRQFTEKGHPGAPCLRSSWVREDTVARWRSVVAPTVERPWWVDVAEIRAELKEAQAAIERVRAVPKSPPRSEFNARANAQDEGWDQALDAVQAALDDPTETEKPH